MNINYTEIANGDPTDATVVMNNFNAIKTVINGHIENTNVSNTSTLNIKSVTATKLTAETVAVKNIILSSGKNFVVKNSNNDEIFKIDESGNIITGIGKDNLLPSGTILMYKGTWQDNVTMPGWYKCDGNNGTPNLVEKFVRGGTSSGQTGGYEDAIIPEHIHTGVTDSHTHYHNVSITSDTYSYSHTHSITYYDFNTGTGTYNFYREAHGKNYGTHSLYMVPERVDHTHSLQDVTTANNTSAHTHTAVAANTGEDGTGKNLPAYYELIYIMKV